MKLEPHEKDLVGAWKLVGSTLIADTTAKRIELLTKNFLVELGSDHPAGTSYIAIRAMGACGN